MNITCAYCGGPITGIKISTKGWICRSCIEKRDTLRAKRREEKQNGMHAIRKVVIANLHRARQAGVPATLTVDQWLSILNEYNWLCFYCRARPYEALEHKIPISLGGGTTAENCVPACTICNSAKGTKAELKHTPY